MSSQAASESSLLPSLISEVVTYPSLVTHSQVYCFEQEPSPITIAKLNKMTRGFILRFAIFVFFDYLAKMNNAAIARITQMEDFYLAHWGDKRSGEQVVINSKSC